MNQPPLNPDASDQYEYRIDALIQRRAKGTDEDFQTFGLALTEDGREYLGESVDDLNSMVSTGLFEVVDGPIPGHCPNCSEKIAAALPEVTSVEELDQLPVGSVVRGGEDDLVGEKIRFSPYLPHWCTIGEEVEADKRDLIPARVLYRPEVKP